MFSHVSGRDRERSWTAFALPPVIDALRRATADRPPRALLDVGCGFGGVPATLRDELGIEKAHGVDIDATVLEEARSKGVEAVCLDIGSEPLPYESGAFDLVTSFGMLDYLPWFDVAMTEFNRVLAPGGMVAVALPNLASWHNRLALVLGYQPRDVEFCRVRAVGLAPFYSSQSPVGHLHTATTRAFREFMTLMGFDEVRTVAIRRSGSPGPAPLRAVDSVLGRFPATSRRFLYIGRRARSPVAEPDTTWWTPN
jgi:SAM-dependent methyltransferase